MERPQTRLNEVVGTLGVCRDKRKTAASSSQMATSHGNMRVLADPSAKSLSLTRKTFVKPVKELLSTQSSSGHSRSSENRRIP